MKTVKTWAFGIVLPMYALYFVIVGVNGLRASISYWFSAEYMDLIFEHSPWYFSVCDLLPSVLVIISALMSGYACIRRCSWKHIALTGAIGLCSFIPPVAGLSIAYGLFNFPQMSISIYEWLWCSLYCIVIALGVWERLTQSSGPYSPVLPMLWRRRKSAWGAVRAAWRAVRGFCREHVFNRYGPGY